MADTHPPMVAERIDALIRRLDVQVEPDPAFASATAAILRSRLHAVRARDASWFGRIGRSLRVVTAPLVSPRTSQATLLLAALVLLLLALVAGMVIVGGFDRIFPVRNGPLIVSVGGEIRAIDVDDGSIRSIGPPGGAAFHVSRSPDGRLVAFWRSSSGGDHLSVMSIDGEGMRSVADERPVTWAGCVDTWSSDSRYIASEVVVDGSSRILIADTTTGIGRLVTPEDVVAHCPLWSPDGQSIVFTQDAGGSTVLATMGIDGIGLRPITGDLDGLEPDGPDTWSRDGWIYFGATGRGTGRIFRVNAMDGTVAQLSDDSVLAVAPTSSPDGTLISFIVDAAAGWDLYVANSDGSDAHRVLERARNNGWSSDGRYVLTRWTPGDRAGGLAVISPDGTGLRLVAPVGEGCPVSTSEVCDIGWGQPRP